MQAIENNYVNDTTVFMIIFLCFSLPNFVYSLINNFKKLGDIFTIRIKYGLSENLHTKRGIKKKKYFFTHSTLNTTGELF